MGRISFFTHFLCASDYRERFRLALESDAVTHETSILPSRSIHYRRRQAMRQFQLVAVALFFTGCAQMAHQAGITEHEMPASGKGQMLQGTDVRGSGFLQDYSPLVPVKGVTGQWEYVRTGVDWKPYTKIMLRPMEVWVNTEANHPAIQVDLYKKIEDTIRQIVTKEFQAGGYEVVDHPAPHVLVFHYALTGVTPVQQGLLPDDV